MWLGDSRAGSSQPQAPPWLELQGQEGQDCGEAAPSLPPLSCRTLTLWAPGEAVRGGLPTYLAPAQAPAGCTWGHPCVFPSPEDPQAGLLLSPMPRCPLKTVSDEVCLSPVQGPALCHTGSATVTLDAESRGLGGCLRAARSGGGQLPRQGGGAQTLSCSLQQPAGERGGVGPCPRTRLTPPMVGPGSPLAGLSTAPLRDVSAPPQASSWPAVPARHLPTGPPGTPQVDKVQLPPASSSFPSLHSHLGCPQHHLPPGQHARQGPPL